MPPITTEADPIVLSGFAPPVTEDVTSPSVSPPDVRRKDLLGGLIHEYYGLAA